MPLRESQERRKKMNRDHFFDEEIEEKFYERIEKKMPSFELDNLRNEFDQGWDEPRQKEKMNLIVEDTQGIIDKRLLL